MTWPQAFMVVAYALGFVGAGVTAIYDKKVTPGWASLRFGGTAVVLALQVWVLHCGGFW